MTKLKAFSLIFFFSLFLSGCNSSTTTIPPTSIPTATSAPQKLTTWTDPAGFIFQYPENIEINHHPEDQQNYANLDIDQVKIIMQDNTFKDLDTWANNPKATSTLLGDKPALKIQTADKILLGAIDNDVLVTIEAPISSQPLFGQIVSSFEFFYPTPTAGKQIQTQPASDNILEEE